MEAANLDTNALFTQYVNVVNKAIGEHKQEFPYKQLLEGGKKLLGDKRIGAAVYKHEADKPHEYFTLELTDNNTLQIASHGKTPEGPDVEWKVREDHLRNVVENPDEFVKHPAKLDLDWLKSRIGS
jgi:hypothetical protein